MGGAEQLDHPAAVEGGVVIDQGQVDVLGLVGSVPSKLEPEHEVDPAVEVGGDVVPLQDPAVHRHELLGGATPDGDGQVGKVGVDGLEEERVGEELRDALVRTPLVHALHRPRVLPGNPLWPHPGAQDLPAGAPSHVHVVGDISGDVPNVVGGGTVPLVTAPRLVAGGGVGVVQLVVPFLQTVLGFGQVSEPSIAQGEVHDPGHDGVVVGVPHATPGEVIQEHEVVVVAHPAVFP